MAAASMAISCIDRKKLQASSFVARNCMITMGCLDLELVKVKLRMFLKPLVSSLEGLWRLAGTTAVVSGLSTGKCVGTKPVEDEYAMQDRGAGCTDALVDDGLLGIGAADSSKEDGDTMQGECNDNVTVKHSKNPSQSVARPALMDRPCWMVVASTARSCRRTADPLSNMRWLRRSVMNFLNLAVCRT